MKALIFFSAIFFILISCSQLSESSYNPSSKDTLDLFSNNIVFNHPGFNKFIDEYFNDSALRDCSYYFLFIGEIKDTIIATLYPIKMDMGMLDIHPLGIIKKEDKVLFVLSHLSNIISYDTSNYVFRSYRSALKEFRLRPQRINKLWMLEIPVYSAHYVIIKDNKTITEKLKFEMKEDDQVSDP